MVYSDRAVYVFNDSAFLTFSTQTNVFSKLWYSRDAFIYVLRHLLLVWVSLCESDRNILMTSWLTSRLAFSFGVNSSQISVGS
jgi:hypothetical protein